MMIPTSMAHLVGKGKMQGEMVVCDFPMLSMVMVDLQNDLTRTAAEYAEVRSIPNYMRHMVGDVQICPKEKMVVVGGKERKALISHQWVLYPLVSDQEKTTVRGGKKYAKRQVSGYMERYFGTCPVVEVAKKTKADSGKHTTLMRIVDDDEEILRLR